MNIVGAPADAASIVAAQSRPDRKARELQKPQTDSAERFRDRVDLRASGVESADAVRPSGTSEKDTPDKRRRPGNDDPPAHVDVKA